MRTIYEREVYEYIKQFGAILGSQLFAITEFPPTKMRRILNRLWKEDLIRKGGPDSAYYVLKNGGDEMDVHCVDCIWVMLANTDKEGIRTAYRGSGAVKLSYVSRNKQGHYHIVYINGEKDYLWINYINHRCLEQVNEEHREAMRFMFVSESEELLRNLPMERFEFPYICILMNFENQGRYKKPYLRTVTIGE